MESIFESKKLELVYNGIDGERGQRQSLNNVTPGATNDDIAEFGQLMGSLAPSSESINSVVIVEKQRIDL